MAEEFRKNVEAKLKAIKDELGEIAQTVSDDAVKERLSALSTNVETLVYETLTQVQSSQPAQQTKKPSSSRNRRQESGFAGHGLEMEQADGEATAEKPATGHRAQQASYGGVAQLFINKTGDEEELPDDPDAAKAAQHKQNISFGGIRQLFEAEQENSAANAEFLVPQDEETTDIAEQKRKHGRHKSIHRRTRSRNSVTDMFAKDGSNPKAQVPEVLAADAENSSSEDSVDKQNRLENESAPITLIQHPLAYDPNRPKPKNWDGVNDLFKDPNATKAAPKNWEGVATLFNLSQADSSAGAEYGGAPMKEEIPKVTLDVKAQNPTNIDVPKEGKDRHHERHISYGGVRQLVEDVVEETPVAKGTKKHEARVHNRNTSFGGVMQIEEDEEDDRHMLPAGLMHDSTIDDDGPETPPGRSGHDRNLSYGGVRQIAGLEEEAENRAAKARAHARNVSIGGVRQISEDDLTNPLQGVEAVQIDIDDGIVSDENPHPSRSKPGGGGHGRKVSYGGVRPLENQDDEDEFFAGDKPRELFDGQARVGDHAGHERRRSRLQDGRELFESPTNKGQGVHRFPNTANAMTAGAQGGQQKETMERLLQNTQTSDKDLARQHLQLKMSKIELIKSTAVEIDRLRDIIRVLASNLKKVRAEHQKLVNATLGTQLAESVSGVFGTLTGFFAPAAPAPVAGSVQGRRSRSHSRRSSRASRRSSAA